MIDELDRCRPNFAIETLEIIKHYFNRKNVIFLIALDIEQLSHSVSTLYGQNMDSEGYLRRFFDLTLNLPKHDGLEYLTSTYKPLLNKTEIPSGFISIMANLYSKLDLSLRDIDKITNSFIIFCLFYKDTISYMRYDLKTLEFYLYFIILKHKYPNTYKHILRVGFMDPSDRPENFPYLDKKYFVSDNINFILKEMQNGAAQQANDKLNGTYGFIQCNKENRSFGENIEKVIEMFI